MKNYTMKSWIEKMMEKSVEVSTREKYFNYHKVIVKCLGKEDDYLYMIPAIKLEGVKTKLKKNSYFKSLTHGTQDSYFTSLNWIIKTVNQLDERKANKQGREGFSESLSIAA